jgi:hypothetical protein
MRHSAGECHITNMRSAGEYTLSVENFRRNSEGPRTILPRLGSRSRWQGQCQAQMFFLRRK